MNTKSLTLIFMLAACAVTIFIFEAQPSPLCPVDDIKPGLAGIATLLAFVWQGRREALTVANYKRNCDGSFHGRRRLLYTKKS